MKGSRPAFFLAASAAVVILALGAYRREFGETLLNAVLLCLSCIGIG